MASRVVPPPATGHFTLKRVPPGTWYRVHPNRYAPGAFNDSGLGNARFSPLMQPGTGEVIPTIYAADTIRGAIMEVVLHDVPRASAGYIHPLARDRKSDNHLSVIQLPELRLVNLTATGLRSVGLTAADMFEGISPTTRAPAHGLHGSGKTCLARTDCSGCRGRTTSHERSCFLETV